MTVFINVPVGTNYSYIQAYVQDGPAKNYRWTSFGYQQKQLVPGQWTSIVVPVPSDFDLSNSKIGLRDLHQRRRHHQRLHGRHLVRRLIGPGAGARRDAAWYNCSGEQGVHQGRPARRAAGRAAPRRAARRRSELHHRPRDASACASSLRRPRGLTAPSWNGGSPPRSWRRRPADRDEIRFGARVTLQDGDGRVRNVQIVGVDETDPAAGLIAFVAPLARALLGHRTGDTVTVRAPGGAEELTVAAVDYDEG